MLKEHWKEAKKDLKKNKQRVAGLSPPLKGGEIVLNWIINSYKTINYIINDKRPLKRRLKRY